MPHLKAWLWRIESHHKVVRSECVLAWRPGKAVLWVIPCSHKEKIEREKFTFNEVLGKKGVIFRINVMVTLEFYSGHKKMVSVELNL